MLSIIIPLFNNYHLTKSCLEDLNKLQIEHEIILVDNGSIDETKKLPCSIRNSTNLGFAKACNQGFAKSNGNYVLFLNNDIKVYKNYESWPEELITGASEGYLVGPTGGLLDNKFDFIKETNEILPGYFYMSGWCLCARREIFKKLDCSKNEIFSEDFVSYFEDTDLSFRAKKKGIGFKIIPIPVTHYGRMTGKMVGLGKLYLQSKSIFINKWRHS